jgi:diaminopropionate ammonia-lyase
MAECQIIAVKGRFDAELLLNGRRETAPARLDALSSYTRQQADQAYARISSWKDYAVTPLRALPHTAKALGLGALWCKDESRRLGLASFKAVGAVYAAVSEVASLLEKRLGHPVSDLDLLAGQHAKDLRDVFLTCCTDGNHGFSVAHAARRMGCRAVIYIPSGVSTEREKALGREGAEVVRIDGIYDEAYEAVEKLAKKTPGAVLISDSATPHYRDIPTRCMTGYAVIAREIVSQLGDVTPTHVMLPAGCGGMAAAMIAAFNQLLRERAPKAIIVEPVTAACVFTSALEGVPTVVGGDLETIMGGLSCAAVSYVAWPILAAGPSAFLRMKDEAAIEAMRLFAKAGGGDPRVVSGETGAAGLAGILALQQDREARDLIGLDEKARVLVINCEGATDPEAYRRLVGQDPVAIAGPLPETVAKAGLA